MNLWLIGSWLIMVIVLCMYTPLGELNSSYSHAETKLTQTVVYIPGLYRLSHVIIPPMLHLFCFYSSISETKKFSGNNIYETWILYLFHDRNVIDLVFIKLNMYIRLCLFWIV